jgi:hypothetical protein
MYDLQKVCALVHSRGGGYVKLINNLYNTCRACDRVIQNQQHDPIESCASVLQGEPSVFESETGRQGMAEPVGRRTTRQVAGVDYDNADTCQVPPPLRCCAELPGKIVLQ